MVNRELSVRAAVAPWEPVPRFEAPGAEAARLLAEVWSAAEAELSQAGAVCRSCGRCCDFRRAEHVLFAAKVELDVCLGWAGERLRLSRAAAERALAEGLCPLWQGGLCRARPVRPLGCRLYFCGAPGAQAAERLSAAAHRRLAAVSRRAGAAWWYGPALAYFRNNVDTLSAAE